MAITFEEYDGDITSGKGRVADELSTALRGALESSLAGEGAPRILRGLTAAGREKAKGRIPNISARMGVRTTIGYSPEGDLVVRAVEREPVEVEAQAEPGPIFSEPAAPAKAVRPRKTATPAAK